jgi:hypothetical protein
LIIDKKYKLEKLVSTEAQRDRLQQIYLTKGMGIACNGHVGAFVPLDEYSYLEEGHLSPESLREARPKAKNQSTYIELTNDKEKFRDVERYRKSAAIEYPNIFAVLPTEPIVRRISFNAKYLYDLAQALGDDVVILELPESNTRVMSVRTGEGKTYANSIGILMPCSLPKEEPFIKEGDLKIDLEYLRSLNPVQSEPIVELDIKEEKPTTVNENYHEFAQAIEDEQTNEMQAEVCRACGEKDKDICNECVATKGDGFE